MTKEQLREARRRLGLTQEGLAAALKLGRTSSMTVSRWKRGERSIPGPVEVAITMMLERTNPHKRREP